MVYPEVIHGMFVDLRSITLDDAEFSYNIRADKRNRDTVGQLAPSLEAQKDFIRWQMQEPNDYYFVVINKTCCVIYANNLKHISDAKKIGGQFIRMEKRSGHDALYFEQDLTYDNNVIKKIKKSLQMLYKGAL